MKDEPQAIAIPNNLIDASNPDISKKRGLVYLKDSLYSGYVTSHYANDSLQSKAGFINGKLEGKSVQFYEDGQLRESRFYAENRKVGLHLGYWPNGNKKFEYHFENGLHVGELNEWYVTGQPYRSFNYEKGQENGSQKMWELDGTIRANYVVKDGHRYGLIGLKNCKSVTDEEGKFTAIAY